MRSIEVSTEVFAKIWASRIEAEEDENAILTRLLGVGPIANPPQTEASGKVRWRDDVRTALSLLGGRAHLRAIYEYVRKVRIEHGRSIPVNLEAIVRRELEYNSSDSHVFTGRQDWFKSVAGIGSGEWALRDECL